MTKIFKSFLIVITIVHFSLIAAVIKAEVVETISVGVPAYRIAITPDGLKAKDYGYFETQNYNLNEEKNSLP